MPNYTYRCEDHGPFDRVRGYDVDRCDCPECGVPAGRVPTFGTPYASHRVNGQWAGERPPREFWEAHNEAMYWKKEAQKAKHEAEMNGFTLKE